MAIVNILKIGSTSYDIAPSANATLSFTSGDDGGSTYTAVAQMKNTDTFGTLFNKISTMCKNIRYLNSKVVTVSNSHSTSTTTAPSSNLVNTMNNTITSLNDAIIYI